MIIHLANDLLLRPIEIVDISPYHSPLSSRGWSAKVDRWIPRRPDVDHGIDVRPGWFDPLRRWSGNLRRPTIEPSMTRPAVQRSSTPTSRVHRGSPAS